jgi:glycosyltransferase involved in cell wall biosynthesis
MKPPGLSSDSPAVSIVIPCYNHARFLADAIQSTDGNQRPLEIIVVDDGSTDDSWEVAGYFPQVHRLRQSNEGLASARNRGLRESHGEFVTFLDADDRLLPGAIDVGAAALESHAGYAMVFGRCLMMGAEGNVLPTADWPRVERDHHSEFLRRNLVWMPGMAMFRREALEWAGGFAFGFDAAADYDLYLRVSRVWPVHDHAELVAAYRQHGGNMSGSATRMLRETRAVMRRNQPHGDERLWPAWHQGWRLWQAFYGSQLVEEIRRHVRRRELRPAVRKTVTLFRHHPALAARELFRKVRREFNRKVYGRD